MHWWLELSEVIRNVGILVGGAIGVYLAWKRVVAANRQAAASIEQSEAATRQADLARRNHVAELFNKAVEQLVSDKMELRLGAIFTLRQIANDFRDLDEPTFQLLSAYLRLNSTGYGEEGPPTDILEIINTLNERIVRK